MFSVSRVDDRVIHGQVVTAWARQYPCEAIIIVDDEIGGSDILKPIYKNAAMGINVFIFQFEQALIKVKEAAESAKPYFLITRSPVVYEQLHRNGVNIGDKLFLGNVSGGEGRKPIALSVCLSAEEIQACQYLDSQGVELVFQTVPTGQAILWKDVSNQL